MDEIRKNAYRYLLYQFLLEIRTVPIPPSSPQSGVAYNGAAAKRSYYAGAVAYQLHNFALASANNFKDFDEAHFWAILERFSKLNPEIPILTRYKKVFELRLAELENQQSID